MQLTFIAGLNPAPLAAAQKLTVREGHFYDALGRRVRFVGLHLKALPSKEEAPLLAARWHQEGINLVRVLAPEPRNHAALPVLIAALKKNGIYLDLVLHTAGSVRDYFDPLAYAQQKQGAIALLTRLRLTEDPVLALLELNPESSLVGQASQIDQLSPAERKPLEAGWNAYLKQKYVTTATLMKRWGGPATLPGKQSLEVGNIELAHLSGIPAGIDYTHFLMTLEDSYCRVLKNAIRATGCTAPITCSQANNGGIAGVWREAKLDWVSLQIAPGTNTLEGLAMHRGGGKPFVVSESPAEQVPLLFAYAAWQDADAGTFLTHRAEVRFERDPGPIAFGVLVSPTPLRAFVWDSAKQQVRVDSAASKVLIGKLAGDASRVTGFVAEVARGSHSHPAHRDQGNNSNGLDG